MRSGERSPAGSCWLVLAGAGAGTSSAQTLIVKFPLYSTLTILCIEYKVMRRLVVTQEVTGRRPASATSSTLPRPVADVSSPSVGPCSSGAGSVVVPLRRL
ncbi:hypothetical protein RR48_11643 [Papilio machaon]|uniref:Uncharacterized protein n=1 Tax=Papilio machaon TaxID=76193 RepID=A0A194R3X2_PAPMA|nr:hypothetical protein RR48_11643 [Papilio machaon]